MQMRFQVALFVCLAVAALALGLVAAAGGVVALEVPAGRYPDGFARIPVARRHVGSDRQIDGPRGQVGPQCARPSTLHLLRLEDGSAQLKCGVRVLARVSVPGR
jgi:hypothetical protein